MKQINLWDSPNVKSHSDCITFIYIFGYNNIFLEINNSQSELLEKKKILILKYNCLARTSMWYVFSVKTL